MQRSAGRWADMPWLQQPLLMAAIELAQEHLARAHHLVIATLVEASRPVARFGENHLEGSPAAAEAAGSTHPGHLATLVTSPHVSEPASQ